MLCRASSNKPWRKFIFIFVLSWAKQDEGSPEAEKLGGSSLAVLFLLPFISFGFPHLP